MRTLAQGRYTLGRLLGVGGMAEVYEATDTVLGASRAIKLLRPGGADWERTRARLRREASVMARLNHPHVLKVVDVGLEGGQDYVVMELASAGSLADRLEAAGRLPLDEVLRWTVQVLSALQAAHDAGVVHRDVKPQNVLLDARGNALLADFGIALISDVDQRHTRTDSGLGSLVFMAPEQRLDARAVGPAADLYSVGCFMFNLLTGASPMDLFLSDDGSARWQLVPASLRLILRRAVAPRPEDRQTSAHALAQELGALHPEGAAWMHVFDVVAAPPEAGPRATMPLAASTLAGLGSDAWAPTLREDTAAFAPAPVPATPPPARLSRGWAALVVAGLALLGWLALAPTPPYPPSSPAPPGASAGPAPSAPETPPAVAAGPDAAGPAVMDAPAIVDAPAITPSAPLQRAPRRGRPADEGRAGAADAVKGASVASDGPSGSWTGTLGGFVFELSLGGSVDALRGSSRTWSRDGKKSSVTSVDGSYDVDERKLSLRDVSDEPLADACEYSLTLSVDARKLTGACRAHGGVTTPIVLQRRP